MIKFYSTRGLHGCFSNFSRYQLILDGKEYKNSESAYQASKFETTDPEYAEKIRLAATPREAADLGRANKEKLRPDWEEIKFDVMRKVVRKKFETHPEIRKILLATKDEELIENSPRDFVWGCGSDGSGKNMLGKILMEVREELRKKYSLGE